MANTYVQIGSTVTVGAGGASSIDFTSIPQTYTDLLLVTSTRVQTLAYEGEGLVIRFNGATTNYTQKQLYGNGSTAASYSGTKIYAGRSTSNSATANTFSNNQCYIPNYSGATNKSLSTDGVNENNATAAGTDLEAGLWSSTAAITSISLLPDAASTILQYSTATLYGIL